jgi:nucleotide-binding universal stress UspA family protein
MTQQATRSLEQIEKDRIPTAVKTQKLLALGDAADEIVKRSEKEKADIIVMVTHGWIGWRKWVFGSVADKVVRSAATPSEFRRH